MGQDRKNQPKPKPDANAYNRRLERVVELVEKGETFYDVLGVRPNATKEEILKAHQRVVGVLNPLFHKSTALVSVRMQKRIDIAFRQVTVASTVLADVSRRIHYDKFIGVNSGALEHQRPAHSGNGDSQGPNPPTLKKAEQQSSAAQPQPQPHESTHSPASNQSADNRRKIERLKLALPVRVNGYDRTTGKWSEMSETIDVSRNGTMLRLRRRVRHRSVVHLSLPLPFELRSHSGLDPDYKVYALVRRVDPPRDGRRIVALEFLGEKPPKGLSERPWGTFRIKWTGAERRREPRIEKSEPVAIEYLDEALQPIRRDEAMSENVGLGGMRIRLSTPAPEFDLVRVIRGDEKGEILAAVSDQYVDKDDVERICVRFIGKLLDSAFVAEYRVEHAHAKGKKILIADDDPPLRKVLGKILTDAGYDVVLAEDGQDAVEKAASERPDLVITDGLMPRMHGFLACKTIKQMESPPPVILLTAVYTKRNYKWEAREQYGADDLLTKPFELSELLACIEKHLAEGPLA